MERGPRESNCHQEPKRSTEGELSMAITTKSNAAANTIARNQENTVQSIRCISKIEVLQDEGSGSFEEYLGSHVQNSVCCTSTD